MGGKSWWAGLPAPAQWFLRWLALLLANLLLAGIVCSALGWTDVVSISNALFFDAAALLLLGLLIQWAVPVPTAPSAPPPSPPGRDQEAQRVEQMLAERWRRRQRPIHGWAVLCFTAAGLIFGLSLLVPAVWARGGL